jgi:hypothetical protein
MTQKIRSQASRFWTALAGAATLEAYKNAINVTFTILKEGVILIWLLLCLVLVFFDWGATQSKAAGQKARTWFENLKHSDSSAFTTNAKQTLLLAGKSSVTNTIAKARETLGLPEKETASAPTPSASTPSATPPSASTESST